LARRENFGENCLGFDFLVKRVQDESLARRENFGENCLGFDCLVKRV
jgi:hypothetical protein